MLVAPSITTQAPTRFLFEDFVPSLTSNMFAASPILPVLLTSPTHTRLIEPSELLVSLNELEPGYDLTRALLITVRRITQSSYVAAFAEANINASGATVHDALANIKALVVDMFDLFRSVSPNQLGPEPVNQRRVLMSVIRKSK